MTNDSVQREVSLDIDPAEAWELVGTADGLERWLADEVDVDVAPAGAGTVREGDVVRQVRIDRVDPGRELAFRWWQPDHDSGSSVVITISPADHGTVLRVVETRSGTAGPRASASVAAAAPAMQWEVRVLLLWAGAARLAVR